MDKFANCTSRQVHLDFHTSEYIKGIGEQFDRKQFQQALKLGRITTINVFAKCHHSWSYYPTQIGRPHPHLKIDLLGEQIAACHAIGVRAPIYYTVGWSAVDAETHPEWTARYQDGSVVGAWDASLRDSKPKTIGEPVKPSDPKPPFQWKMLCPSGGYRKLMLDQTAELCQRFDVDGFWYDICFAHCYCENCRAAMKDRGLDPSSEVDGDKYNTIKWRQFMTDCRDIIFARHPGASVFFNGGTRLDRPQYHDLHTQFDLEDLPTTWGGYDKFPLRSRYFAEKHKAMVAMSGKFHTSWGEFGGFKNPEALRFEAAAMIAYGANCNFGDQLHPCGVMDLTTYRNIGHAFKYVEQIEEYGLDGKPAANLGLWLSGQNEHDQGVANMLLETGNDFRVIQAETDLSVFDAIILTGSVLLDEAQAARLNAFVAAGGGLLLLGRSGLDPKGEKFAIDVGAEYVGPGKFVQDYLLAGRTLGKDVPPSPVLCYHAAHRVRATSGKALGNIREPFFDRTFEHYCGHQNAPYHMEDASHPAAIRKGKVVYLAHELGRDYFEWGAKAHRDYFRNALELVYRRPALRVDMTSAGRATFVHQPEKARYVAHLLYGPPLQRGKCQIIEDLPTLRDVEVEFRVPEKIKRAYTVPDKKKLALRRQGGGKAGAVSLRVPEFSCHTAVVLEY